jgi:hypothetical protein
MREWNVELYVVVQQSGIYKISVRTNPLSFKVYFQVGITHILADLQLILA